MICSHRSLLIIIIWAIGISITYGQDTLILLLNYNGKENAEIEELTYKKELPDKKQIIHELSGIRLALFDKGYLAARVDTIIQENDTVNAYITLDKKYELAYLGRGNVDENVWDQVVTKKDSLASEEFSYKEIKYVLEELISYYERKGYPFVQIGLDSLIINRNTIRAKLDLEKGIAVKIDSIIIKGSARIRTGYIYNYLNIRPGDLYNEAIIKKISKNIEEIPFIEEKKPFEISFTEKGAWIYLYLDKKNASRFDGILGVMPNNETTGKLLITGDVSLLLNNSFRWGEMISFNWRKIEQNTQDLKINIIYPFVLSTPFIIDYGFSLLKKDTLYYTVNNVLGLQYHFAGNNYLKVFVDQWNSNLISTSGLEYANILPDYADIKTRLYGLNYHLAQLDYLYNPLRGFHIDLKASAGNKTIKKNKNLNQELYRDIDLTTIQFTIAADIGTFIPVAQKVTIWLRSQTAYINNQDLFENELFRIGGMRVLRGFDEGSIYASLYSVYTAEIRYLFERNSFFNIFYNGAYYEKNTRENYIVDRPFGFGAGLNFETKAGIFSINYALGKQFDNPIDLRSAKIHFGFINTF